MHTVINVTLAACTLLFISLQRGYRSIPAKELKKRAREGDEMAAGLYRAVGYGHSLRTVLWFLVIASSSLFFVSIATSSPLWLALVLSAIIVWFGYVWLPVRRTNTFSTSLARMAAPVFARLLSYLHPFLDWLVLLVRRHTPVTIHTGLYDKDDLIDLFEQQIAQADNRIAKEELDIAYSALTAGEKLVRDVMTPRRVVSMINAEDSVGPILMTEVHDSGHSRYPVYDGKKDNIVGTIYLRDLMRAKEGGRVRDVMRSGDVCYIHEEQSLVEALQAILKTRRHLFIVVNSFEEYVGVITIEDVLEHIIGRPIIDEFDQYDDLRAVAARVARQEHKAHQESAGTSLVDTNADGMTEPLEAPEE
jgi:CBS domain containing-hemolysin-like protein